MARAVIPLEHEVDSQSGILSVDSLSELVNRSVRDGALVGAVLLVSKDNKQFAHIVAGNKATGVPDTPIEVDTVFDIGSATMSIVTTTLLMRLFDQGKFRLEDRVSRFLQGMGVAGKSATTMEHLLSHTAGLSPSLPIYEDLMQLNSGPRLGMLASSGAKQFVYDQVLKAPLRNEPGARFSPSELSFILLGQICEILSAMPLDKAFQKLVARPLGMRTSSFIDLSLLKQRGYQPATELFAGTGECSRRKRLLCGEISDLTAWAMGGVAGHAGLFSVAQDLEIWAKEIIDATRGRGKLFSRQTVGAFWKTKMASETRPYRLGFEVPNRENGLQEVTSFSSSAAGVTGDTGSSVWIDAERGVTIVLLTSGQVSKRGEAARAEIISRVSASIR